MHALLAVLARLTSSRPRLVVVVLAVVTIALGVVAQNQSTDAELSAFATDSELSAALDRVQKEFGAGGSSLEVVIDAGDDGNVLDDEGRAAAQAVDEAITTTALSGIDGEVQVQSFAQADDVFDEGTARLLSNDLEAGSARAGLVVASFPPTMTEDEVAAASVELAEAIDALDTASVEVSPFNGAVLGAELQAQSEEEMPRLLSISLLLILIILGFQYRTVSDVVVGLVGLVVSIVWLYGFGVLLGPGYLGLIGPFSQITMIVPVLLVGLGIDYAIHLTSRYREEQSHAQPPDRAAVMAVRTVGGALVLATVTTMVGFLTNLFSPLPPIADFGVLTAVGVLGAFVVMTLLVPSMRNILDSRKAARGRLVAKPHRPASTLSAVIGRTAVIARRAPEVALGVALVLSVAATVAATQVNTTFSQDDFIPDESEIGLLIDRIQVLFGGGVSETTYVLLDGDLTDPTVAATQAEVIDGFVDVDGVRTAAGAAQVTPTIAASGDAGMLAIATAAGQDGANALAERLATELAPLEAVGVSTTVTSEPLVLEESLSALTDSQARGILITLMAALALLMTYYGFKERKPVLGIITMIPSVAVVTWVLGTMWLLGISFNVLTAMVASLGIGIGVPFGIHVTHRFLEDRRRYDTIDEAVAHTVTHTGGAMAGSAATTAMGFGVLVFASLVPMQQFGIIVAITIVYSFIAAVLVQPSCLKLWGEHRARRGDASEPHEHEVRPSVDPRQSEVPELV